MSSDVPDKVIDLGTVVTLIGKQQRQVYDLFEESSREGGTRAEGERRVALGNLRDRLSTIARLIGSSGSPTPDFLTRSTRCLEQLGDLQRGRSSVVDVEAVWEAVNDLDMLLLELASASDSHNTYLWIQLEKERRQDASAQMNRPEVSTALPWSELYDPKELDALLSPRNGGTTCPPGQEWPRQRALELLGTLYQARRAKDRERRAREQLRKKRLQWVFIILLPILVLAATCLAFALVFATGTRTGLQAWIQVPLAVLMGSLGAGLAGASVLREESVRDDAIARFKAAYFAQLTIGGTFGLIALALLRAGVLPAFQGAGTDASVVALVIYAFLAGYSEPFVLGILRGLSGRGDARSGSGTARPAGRASSRPQDS